MGKSKNNSKKQSKPVETVEVVSEDEVEEVVSEDEVEVVIDNTTNDMSGDTTETNTVVDETSADEESFEDVLNRIAERNTEILKLQKANIRDTKTISKVHNKSIRYAKKNRRNKNSSNRKLVKSGFNKPTPVPEEIAKLFDIEEGTLLARTVVTKMVYQYIRDNELQNPENKREIRPDHKIRKLFQLTKSDKLSFENFQTHMKKLYPPSKKDLAAIQEKENIANSSA
jgi:chromatin remodeling complex protein RSC6